MNTPLRVGIVGLEPGRSWATVALNLHRLLEDIKNQALRDERRAS